MIGRDELTRGSLVSLGFTVARAVLVFALQVFLARWLGVGEYGQYVYAMTIAGVLSFVSLLGADAAVVRFLPQLKSEGDHGHARGLLRRSYQVVTAAAVVCAVALAGGALLGRGRLEVAGTAALVLAAVSILPAALKLLNTGVLRSCERVAWARMPDAVASPLLLSALVTAAVLLLGLPAIGSVAVGARAATELLLLCASGLLVTAALPAEQRRARPLYAMSSWASVAIGLAVSQWLLQVVQQADVVILGWFVGAREVGLYAAAARVARVADLAQEGVAFLALPMFSRHFAVGGDGLQSIATRAARLALLVVAPLVAGGVLLRTQVLAAFGPEFTAAAPCLLVLLLGRLLQVSCGLGFGLLAMTGHERIGVLGLAGMATATVVGNLLLIPSLGMLGCAIATSTAGVAGSAWLAWTVRRTLGLDATVIGRG